MLADHVVRGAKAGLVAGLAFGLLLALVANPVVAYADGLGPGGDHGAAGHDESHGTADRHEASGGESDHGGVVSSAVTNGVSVASGVLWGLLLGTVVFGVGFSLLEPAIPGSGATKSYVLAAAGFLTVSGAPWLLFPPQPPGAEQALPTETRLLLYGGMMVAGGAVCLASGAVYRRFAARRGRTVAAVAATAPLGLLAVPVALSPSNPVTSSVPTGLATGLTGLVVFGQVLLWVVLAATHARLGDRSEADAPPAASLDRTDSAATAD